MSVSACSCVQTSKVLFVLPMYEELQPGQVNSYTTFDWLNGGVLFSVLVKKHNFVVFSFIWMSIFGSMRHRWSLHLSFLTSCIVRSPTSGMLSHIVECWLLWELSLVKWFGALFCAFVVKRSINKFATRLGKPFHDKNFLISLSSVLILLGVQIRCTRSISALTQEILCRQGTKLSKLVYCPVKVSFCRCQDHH